MALCSGAPELLPELGLGLVERFLSACGQRPAGPVDVEREHRQRGAIRIGLAPPAPFGRALERCSDLLRTVQGEHPAVQVERVALFSHTLRPLATAARALARAGGPPRTPHGGASFPPRCRSR